MKKIIRLFKKKELPLQDLKPRGVKVVGKRLSFNEMAAKQPISTLPFTYL